MAIAGITAGRIAQESQEHMTEPTELTESVVVFEIPAYELEFPIKAGVKMKMHGASDLEWINRKKMPLGDAIEEMVRQFDALGKPRLTYYFKDVTGTEQHMHLFWDVVPRPREWGSD